MGKQKRDVKNVIVRILCFALAIFMVLGTVAMLILYAAEVEGIEEYNTFTHESNIVKKDIPLLVILASFDANGNGKDDFDPNNPGKTYSDTKSPIYGEQWVGTTPEQQYATYFAEEGSVAAYYKEMTCGRVNYFPVEFKKQPANSKITEGVISVVVNSAHPTAYQPLLGNSYASNCYKIQSMIVEACNDYVDFDKYDTNHDGRIAPTEMTVVILNAGADGATSGNASRSYHNASYPKWYFEVHGTANSNVNAYVGENKDIKVYYVCNFGETRNAAVTNTKGSVGVACHEIAHTFGAEDLYNRSTSPYTKKYEDASWPRPYTLSLQDSGCHNSSGELPSYLDPYQRVYLGWADEVIAKEDGIYELKSTATGDYYVLRVPTLDPTEYYLVEIRTRYGFEKGTISSNQKGGVLIWHIDDDINIAQGLFYKAIADSSYQNSAGESHDPGIIPLSRNRYNNAGNRMTKNSVDIFYYASDKGDVTSLFDPNKFSSATNKVVALNSYPEGYIGEEKLDLRIQVLDEPGDVMRVLVTGISGSVVTESVKATYNTITYTGKVTSDLSKVTEVGVVFYGIEGDKTEYPLEMNEDGTFTYVATDLKPRNCYYVSGYVKTTNGAIGLTDEKAQYTEKLTVKDINVSFETNGGSTIEPVSTKSNAAFPKPEDPTKVGHIFAGWFSDEELTIPYDVNVKQMNSEVDVKVYAKWEPISIKLTLVSSYENEETKTYTLVYGEDVNCSLELLNREREGYTFDGLFKDEEFSVPYDANAKVSELEDFNVYTKWTEIPKEVIEPESSQNNVVIVIIIVAAVVVVASAITFVIIKKKKKG